MTSFSIEYVGLNGEVEESVIVELIDLIATQDIHPNGLTEIKFSYFK